ncbi:serine hydrolase [Mucilaginibacter sp. AW1-7]|uniref:serine hydrolase n=1 Tax=Mucilaginibacter sp. AW1-7 TaxID=3349874 RepID=UPI003F73E81C
MKKTLLMLMLSILASSLAKAQNLRIRLDSLFNKQYAEGRLNGNVLIAEKGKIIYKRSFGYADINRKILNDDQSEFELASVSKTLTATAVLQLMQKNKVGLNDPYKKYFPAFPYPSITIRNLLSHTSGLPRDKENIFDTVLKACPDDKFSYHDILATIEKYHPPLSYIPGEKWTYSNINYNLLALLVEKVTNMPFDKYMKKYVFNPAGMNNTYFKTNPPTPQSHITRGYYYPKHYYANLKPVDSVIEFVNDSKNYTVFWGQGSLVSTTFDLFKFDQSLYSNKLVNLAILERAFKPVILNDGKEAVAGGGVSYGLGWYVLKTVPSEEIVLHTGYVPGIRTVFFRNVSKNQTVIVFDNTESRANFITGSNALCILNNRKQEVTKISIADRYAKIISKSGPDAAAVSLFIMKADTTNFNYNGGEMDYIGHELLKDGYAEKALEAFKINVLLNPANALGYRSYGEALTKANKKQDAIRMYKKAISLQPDDTNAKVALEKLEAEK